ncbi:hypothetical protein HD598_001664 [Neomicrococcus aestuarii]|uniref:Mini-circle protein n=1 Tax=Neomicrococcus aestuarii TaxID=556325 RepID=A0A7W8X086_9MICC|nr:DUF664 domain-containing protein [Neomicrococcus aestuarii]MBB5512977.1 hypothetical protein [Neomicrococcus aestuarii]
MTSTWYEGNDAATPWEPPLNGTEAEHLLGALDRLRATFRWKAGGLNAEQLATRLGPSTLTIGGLLKHLTNVEAVKFTWDLAGSNPGEPWASLEDTEWPFTSAATDSPEELYNNYDAAVLRSREILAAALAGGGSKENGGLGQAIYMSEAWGQTVSLRRLVYDLVEEYGRHTGHADLIRESIDGLVGEDPPAHWRPEGSAN